MLRRLGFTEEAHRRDGAFVHGEYVDTYDYAVLAAEWNPE
jgi:RimJ/RimL family protein N-acetyltransferase